MATNSGNPPWALLGLTTTRPTATGSTQQAKLQANGGVGTTRRRGGLLARNKRLACPQCGLALRDPIAAKVGFCDRCRDFTCMCGAGRKIVCPDMMSVTSWHSPCTALGVAAWKITLGYGAQTTLLCRQHEAQLKAGDIPWITGAIPLG
jgi:hypothetical protein